MSNTTTTNNNNNNMNTTSLTAAIKEILAQRNGLKPTVKETLEILSKDYPQVKASYRPVFGTLARLFKDVNQKVKAEAEVVVENIIFDLTIEPTEVVKGKVHKKGSRKTLIA